MTEVKVMFSVSISQELFDEIEKEAEKQGRSKNKQIIHWVKLGKLLEANPDIKTSLLLREQLQ